MLISKENYLDPHVIIFMATYNGSAFLEEQLLSIENQSYGNWSLIVSDDGSTDTTLNILKKFKDRWGGARLRVVRGPQEGYCKNFLSMACDRSVVADLYAFSDQDDVWLSDKLLRAVNYFQANDSITPRLYCSRTKIVDEDLRYLGLSPNYTLPKSFRNAISQSIAGGNTMVFNHEAKCKLEAAGLQNVVSHDWWLYQITQGVGGEVYFDSKPTLLYRQHSNSLIGSSTSFRSKIKRFRFILEGRFSRWNTINYNALHNVEHLLTSDSRNVLFVFNLLRNVGLFDRLRLLVVCGLYRQTWAGTISLWIAVILNKI